MAASDHADLIRRKVQGAGTQANRGIAARPELDALRAAARAAYSSAGLKVDMRGSSAEDLADLSALIVALEGAMLIVPCRANDGAEGYIGLSHEFAQALIEKATTGALSALPLEPRHPSSIDMLLCRDFLCRFMDSLQEISEGKETADWISGYHPQETPVDTGLMALHTRDVPYQLFRVEVRLEDTRDAQLLTAFPVDRHPKPPSQGSVAEGANANWGKIWRDTVMDTHAALDAVLVQLPVPLKDIQRWTPDDVLEVPADALSNVTLGRRGGSVVATARLGQAHGHRALRLSAMSTQTEGDALPAQTTPPAAKPEFETPDSAAPGTSGLPKEAAQLEDAEVDVASIETPQADLDASDAQPSEDSDKDG